MAFNCKVLADSISDNRDRLTTLEVTLPRIVLAEFNTHRVFSRNSASSRAIPVEKMIQMVSDDPYIPTTWGKNQKGMQADEDVDEGRAAAAELMWLRQRDQAILTARAMIELGIHKQLTNRLLEPWMWQTIIVSSTEWLNYFHLRCHKDAHPEIRRAALLMRDAMDGSMPTKIGEGDWHLPLVFDEDVEQVLNSKKPLVESRMKLVKISVGRCARVSYLTHDGKRDLDADVELCDRLTKSGHMSPLEHAATPMTFDEMVHGTGWSGNFKGWNQYRKTIDGENDMLKYEAAANAS